MCFYTYDNSRCFMQRMHWYLCLQRRRHRRSTAAATTKCSPIPPLHLHHHRPSPRIQNYIRLEFIPKPTLPRYFRTTPTPPPACTRRKKRWNRGGCRQGMQPSPTELSTNLPFDSLHRVHLKGCFIRLVITTVHRGLDASLTGQCIPIHLLRGVGNAMLRTGFQSALVDEFDGGVGD